MLAQDTKAGGQVTFNGKFIIVIDYYQVINNGDN